MTFTLNANYTVYLCKDKDFHSNVATCFITRNGIELAILIEIKGYFKLLKIKGCIILNVNIFARSDIL